MTKTAKGKVINAFGNLLQVAFDGDIRQGEVAMVKMDGTKLKAEVIEIAGNEAKIQVFEDTRGVEYLTPVDFHRGSTGSGTRARLLYLHL